MKFRRIKSEQLLDDDLSDVSVWRPKTVLWLILILAALALLFWFVYRVWAPPRGVYRAQFEGRIVDKWADYSETDQGSVPQFRLLVEGVDRNRFVVSVSPDIYERSKVGMKVRRTARGNIELMIDESQPQSRRVPRKTLMTTLMYSLVIESTDDPNFFGFYSPNLEGFTGAGQSIKDCLAKAHVAMKEHIELLKQTGRPVPAISPSAKAIVRNPKRGIPAA